MTKAQRAAKAKRAGAKRRKANAAAAFLRKMNPGRKLPAAVRVKRLKGGGISVTPLKVNAPKGVKVSKKKGYFVTTEGGIRHYFRSKRARDLFHLKEFGAGRGRVKIGRRNIA